MQKRLMKPLAVKAISYLCPVITIDPGKGQLKATEEEN